MDNGEGAPPGQLEQNGEQPSNINFSDVFEAISLADPSYGAGGASSAPGAVDAGVAAGAGGVDEEMYRPTQEQRPYCRILEQPASKALRFRYECEGRSAGSIPGANSTPEKKTFPTIEIVGHKGRAIVVVSCVTKDHKDQYRPHPHNLVGRELCKKGVCTVNVGAESGGVVTFSNLGIQCVKRRDIEDALRVREEMRVDPFKTGFSHKSQPQSIDLNAVRLCFQVFLPDERTGKIRHALPPVVSDVIYDKKAMSDLVISRLSHASAPATGGTKIILLCEKVAREDIAVTFYESGAGGSVVWRADAGELYVHKQVAICCSTPRYREPAVTRHVQAFIQLRRLSDNQTSEPVAFELLPTSADSDYLRRKRQKTFDLNPSYSQPPDQDMNPHMPEYYELLAMQREPIKLEPRERQPSLASPPLSVYQSPQRDTPDPHYQQWTMPDNMQGGLAVPGSSHLSPYQGGDMTWGQNMSPLAPAVSPNMAHAPHMSPNLGHRSPNMGHGSPSMGHVSPNMGHVSPNMGHVSPNMGHVSPNMGHVSPNMAQMQSTMLQQQTITQLQQTNMECTTSSDPPSITGLLLGNECMPQLNSSELSGLSSLLADADRPTDTLSETLNRLSTADLMPSHMQ